MKNIRWHSGLSDDELLALYQKSYLLILPMDASGANTAIVESLASGLPIVTTDVGGIRDYGGGSVFPLIENNDVDGMVNQIDFLLNHEEIRENISLQSRKFAEDHLEWRRIAMLHLEAYLEFI